LVRAVIRDYTPERLFFVGRRHTLVPPLLWLVSDAAGKVTG
jgi:hypothetical protein